jgi:hypothetical protein
MTAALAFTPDDYRLPPETVTRKVKVRCGCGVRSRPFNMTDEGIAWLKTSRPPPSLIVGSWWCRDCNETVKVTARHLHLVD